MIGKRKGLPEGVVRHDTLEHFAKDFLKLLGVQSKHPEAFAFLNEQVVGNPVTLGSRVISPQDWAKKQIDRAAAAGDTWATNVQRPRKDPVGAAIAADAKRKDRLKAAEAADKWKKKMAKVDVDAMYATIRALGSGVYTTGVTARTAKISNVINDLQPKVAALAAAIDQMPDDTDANREKRMLASRKGMIAIGQQRAG
ncbi:MAG TPA: hypothetical protein VEG35_02885 [Burkholderiales bacterium]|nr:hypothetical protein [Burkholderiales bacterium]